MSSKIKIPRVYAIRTASILDDAVAKLSLLDSLAPDVFQHRNELSKFIGEEISKALEEQKELEIRYQALIEERANCRGLANKAQFKEVQRAIEDVSRALKESTANLTRNLNENPNISGNLMKIQRDRNDLNDLLSHCLREISDHGTFLKLSRRVDEDVQMQNRLDVLKQTERELRREVGSLSKELEEERKGHESTVRNQQSSASRLKQELRTFKQVSGSTSRHREREAHASINCIKRMYRQEERQLEDRIQELTSKLETERKVSEHTTHFLESKIAQLRAELVSWSDRQDLESEALERRLVEARGRREQLLRKLNHLREREAKEREGEAEAKAERERLWREEAKKQSQEMRENRAARTLQEGFKIYFERKAIYEANKAASKKKKGGGGGKKKKK